MYFPSSSVAVFAAVLAGVSQVSGETIVVSVGKNGPSGETKNLYFPEKVTAKVGDEIQMQFLGGNHTATQSTFDNPCVPMSSGNGSAVAGIKSGFQPAMVAAAKGEVSVFTFTVRDTAPMWFYCAQACHCQGGMVMSINENPQANATRTLENFKQLAARAQGSNGTSTGTSGGTASTTNSAAAGRPNVSGASASFVAIPATLLLALGSAFMLL